MRRQPVHKYLCEDLRQDLKSVRNALKGFFEGKMSEDEILTGITNILYIILIKILALVFLIFK